MRAVWVLLALAVLAVSAEQYVEDELVNVPDVMDIQEQAEVESTEEAEIEANAEIMSKTLDTLERQCLRVLRSPTGIPKPLLAEFATELKRVRKAIIAARKAAIKKNREFQKKIRDLERRIKALKASIKRLKSRIAAALKRSRAKARRAYDRARRAYEKELRRHKDGLRFLNKLKSKTNSLNGRVKTEDLEDDAQDVHDALVDESELLFQLTGVDAVVELELAKKKAKATKGKKLPGSGALSLYKPDQLKKIVAKMLKKLKARKAAVEKKLKALKKHKVPAHIRGLMSRLRSHRRKLRSLQNALLRLKRSYDRHKAGAGRLARYKEELAKIAKIERHIYSGKTVCPQNQNCRHSAVSKTTRSNALKAIYAAYLAARQALSKKVDTGNCRKRPACMRSAKGLWSRYMGLKTKLRSMSASALKKAGYKGKVVFSRGEEEE